MSGITRYAVIETALCIGSSLMEGEVFMVMATDHDRELAALREDLAGKHEELSAVLGREACTEQRLAAAEQRNSELLELLRNPSDKMVEAGNGAAVVEMEHDSDLGSCGWISNADEVLAEMLKIVLKPTESGASEEDEQDRKTVFVRSNTKKGQYISMADMQARYEDKP